MKAFLSGQLQAWAWQLAIAVAPQTFLPSQPAQAPRTISYAALGDSYASGVGAGRFIVSNQTDRGLDNPCARMDGSYPWQLTSNHMDQRVSSLHFLACTGDGLEQLDHQVKQLEPKSIDVASLSMSGNDFFFAGVVSSCVYAYSGFWGEETMQKYCQAQLEVATAAIANETIWQKYRQKVQNVREKLTDDGWLYITGYGTFWSPDGTLDDECSKRTFFHYPEGLLGNLHLYWITRIAMNTLVNRVNSHIKRKVVDALGGEASRIRFIDIESSFDSHRFCEPGQDPYSSETNFYSFYSELEETGTWHGPVNPAAIANVPDGSNMTHSDGAIPELIEQHAHIDGLRWLWDSYRRFSTFHPAKAAHEITAKRLAYYVIHDIFPRSEAAIGPDRVCIPFGPEDAFETCVDVPDKCAALHPTTNSTLEIVCHDGTSIIMRPG